MTRLDHKKFDGDFLVFRKTPQGLRKRTGPAVPKPHAPQFRHPTRAAAEAEAVRLLGMFPESTFVILQEVGRFKLLVATSPTPAIPEGSVDD